jgi:hypothetical protein
MKTDDYKENKVKLMWKCHKINVNQWANIWISSLFSASF